MKSVTRKIMYLSAALAAAVLFVLTPVMADGSTVLNSSPVYVTPGTYHIHTSLNTNQVIDVSGAGTSNGTKIQLYSKKLEMQGSENQKFEIKRLSSGWYTIKDVNSGKMLDVKGGSKASGTAVQLYASNNTKAQHWKFYSAGNGNYYIKNQLGCYLDAKGGASANGTQVQVYKFNATAAQKWQLSAALKKSAEIRVSASTKTFRSGLNKKQVIDVSGAGTANGTKIQLWNSNGTECQKFDLYRESSGWYEIVDANSGKALDVQGGAAGNSVKVQLYERNHTKAQHWKFYSAGSGYYYVQNEIGYFLDAKGGASANGTQIQVYQFNGTNAQKWMLSNVSKNASVTGISLNVTSKELKVGETFTLTASITPANASDKRVSWSSDNSLVAAVSSSGVVTGKTAGTTVIRAATANGKTAACTVKVVKVSSTTDQICDAISRDTSLGLTSSKKTTLVIMARTLLNAGYEPTFVAGVLANIRYEGSVGQFESSNYRSGEPKYLVYMDKNFSYRTKYSGKNITSVSLNEVYNMLVTLKNRNWPGKFGLGCIQWTGGRTYSLVELYRACAGGSDRITFDQASQAECKMIIQELRGKYLSVYNNWKSANKTKSAENASYDAASRFCLYYEVPANRKVKAVQRGNFAKKLYKVMMK